MDNNKNKNCSTCKWAYGDEIGDYYCVNTDSPKRSDWTTKEDSCKKWEKNDNVQSRGF